MSRSLYRLAFEAEAQSPQQPEDAKQTTVVMQGPLAEIYRKALDVVYAKQDPVTGEPTVGQANDTAAVPAAAQPEQAVATESQANDAMMLSHLRDMIANHDQALTNGEETEEDGSPSALLTIYGVSEGDLAEDDVVNVTKQLAQKSPARDFVLILDATQGDGNANNAGNEKLISLGEALESIVEAHGCRVYHSLQEAAAAIASR